MFIFSRWPRAIAPSDFCSNSQMSLSNLSQRSIATASFYWSYRIVVFIVSRMDSNFVLTKSCCWMSPVRYWLMKSKFDDSVLIFSWLSWQCFGSFYIWFSIMSCACNFVFKALIIVLHAIVTLSFWFSARNTTCIALFTMSPIWFILTNSCCSYSACFNTTSALIASSRSFFVVWTRSENLYSSFSFCSSSLMTSSSVWSSKSSCSFLADSSMV